LNNSTFTVYRKNLYEWFTNSSETLFQIVTVVLLIWLIATMAAITINDTIKPYSTAVAALRDFKRRIMKVDINISQAALKVPFQEANKAVFP
jgi:hypothetical protein